ncbi:MAG: hypothetical protein ACYDA2_06495 [Acidimicrobiales bacterium]
MVPTFVAGAGGVAAYFTIRSYAGSRVQTIFETCTFVVAAQVLREDNAFGDVVHSFFGYTSRPTILEIAAWACYIAVAVTAFLGLWPHVLRQSPVTDSSPGRR